MIGLLIAIVVLLVFILGKLTQAVNLLSKQEAARVKAEKDYTEEAENILRALNGQHFENSDKYSPFDLPFDVEEKALNKR